MFLTLTQIGRYEIISGAGATQPPGHEHDKVAAARGRRPSLLHRAAAALHRPAVTAPPAVTDASTPSHGWR